MRTRTWLAALILFLALAVGCVPDRWLEIGPGAYTSVRGTGDAGRDAARNIKSLTVDRTQEITTLMLEDGSGISLAYTARERSEWPVGCPTNIFEHHMEVLDLAAETIEVGPVTLHHPILVRTCPAEPQRLVLREDDPSGEGGSAASNITLIFTR